MQVVADSANAGQALGGLSAAISWTTRLRVNAALSGLAPPRTGNPGRPRLNLNPPMALGVGLLTGVVRVGLGGRG